MDRPTVLLIDDDTGNLRVFERVFRKRYVTLSASTGVMALALIRDAPAIAVAFVDFIMPDTSAAVVLAALRTARPSIARYLLTGYGEMVETTLLQHQGLCRAVLAKPWDRATIEAAVEDAVATMSERSARG